MEIIIATHGALASALKDSAEMIVGQSKEIKTFGLYPDMSIDTFKEELANAIQSREDEDVLILLDLLGGTPFNSIISELQNEHVQFVVGVNLGMLLELLLDSESKTALEASRFVKEKGIASILTKEDVMH